MKNKLILTLALSVIATGAFAEDGFQPTMMNSWRRVHLTLTQLRVRRPA